MFNLDSIVSKCVHRPISNKDESKKPLYKRNDGIFEGEGKQTRSEAWLQAVEHTYSSPNNVRKVCITYKGVWVTYYQPIKGDSSKALEKFYSFDRINKDFNAVELRQNYKPGQVKGTGLKAIKGIWTCSNIEEIWFDWVVLLCDELSSFASKWTASGQTELNTADRNLVGNIFKKFCLKDTNNPLAVFPRLKCIGYCSELCTIMEGENKKPGAESVESFLKNWCDNEKIKAAIKSPNVYVAMYKFNSNKADVKFTTRNFYNYDIEILQNYFADMKNKVNKYYLTQKRGEKPQKSDFRDLLINLEKQYGLSKAVSMAKLMINTDTDNRDKYINSLTDEEKKKYLGGVVQ